MSVAQFERARSYAFLLLKFRPRSEKELLERLKKKKYPGEVIRRVVLFLKGKNFINDTDFTRLWIDERLKRSFGFRRIKQELIQKGVSKEIIGRQIDKFSQDYSEEEVVQGLAAIKLSKLKGIGQEQARNRVFSYLVRRGFSPEIVTEVVEAKIR